MKNKIRILPLARPLRLLAFPLASLPVQAKGDLTKSANIAPLGRISVSGHLKSNRKEPVWKMTEGKPRRKVSLKSIRSIARKYIILLIALSTLIAVIPLNRAHATQTAPLLKGWGGVGVAESDQNSTGCPSSCKAPPSAVFSGERASNMEQAFTNLTSKGLNAERVLFYNHYANKTLNQIMVNHGVSVFNYTDSRLSRTFSIAQHFSIWLVLNEHQSCDWANATTRCHQVFGGPQYNVTFTNVQGNWTSFWQNNVTRVAYSSGYSNFIYEPLNEPHSSAPTQVLVAGVWQTQPYPGKPQNLVGAYQNFINMIRNTVRDTTHFIIASNAANDGDLPTLTDSASLLMLTHHFYYQYNASCGTTAAHLVPSYTGPGNSFLLLTYCGWSNTNAQLWADNVTSYMRTAQARFGWPVISTETGADYLSGSPPNATLAGSCKYAPPNLAFVQELINDFSQSPAIGYQLWTNGDWTGSGVYGCLAGWGKSVTYPTVPSSFVHITTTTQTVPELTVPESEQRTFQNPRGQHGYYAFYRDSLSSVQSCYLATSPDATSWTYGQSTGLANLYDSCGVAFTQNPSNNRTLVYLVASRHSTSVGTNHDIDFRIGSIADSGVSLTWLTSIIALKTSSITENLGYPAIAQDINGYLHVVFSYSNDASGTSNDAQNVEVCSSTTANPTANPSWVCSNPLSNNPFPEEKVANIDTPVAMPHVLTLASGVLIIKGTCTGVESNFVTCSFGSDVIERSAVMTWNGSTQSWGNTASFTLNSASPAHIRSSGINATDGRALYAYQGGSTNLDLVARYIDSPYTTWSSEKTQCSSCVSSGNYYYGAHWTHVQGVSSIDRFYLFFSIDNNKFYSVNETDSAVASAKIVEYNNGTTSSAYPTSQSLVVATGGEAVIPVLWVQGLSTDREIWFEKRDIN